MLMWSNPSESITVRRWCDIVQPFGMRLFVFLGSRALKNRPDFVTLCGLRGWKHDKTYGVLAGWTWRAWQQSSIPDNPLSAPSSSIHAERSCSLLDHFLMDGPTLVGIPADRGDQLAENYAHLNIIATRILVLLQCKHSNGMWRAILLLTLVKV